MQKELDALKQEEAEMENADVNEPIDYERVAERKTRIAKLEADLPAKQAAASEIQVTMDDVAKVIELWTGIPAVKIRETEFAKLANLEGELKKKIIGQDEAVHLVAQAIKRSRADLSGRRRPASFIFVGPTGVGKTELVKQLANQLFDTVDPLISIDMSEYMEKYAVSRLIGAPPGYVGYEEGGQLTEKVRRKPYSIVLLDEIEKAHPDVFNILLQVMDEGRLTDSYGRTVDFKNTIVIMTSNIGTRQLKEFGKGIGFAAQIRTDDKEYSRSVITKALNKSFAPEFINRLDEIITFDQLDLNALTRIIDIELNGLYSRVEHIGYKLVIDEDAKKFVATKGYDVQFGARPLKRAIQNNLEDGISELILGSEMAAGDTIKVSYDKEKASLS